MWLRLRNVKEKKKTFVLSSPLRIPDPFLLPRDPGLLINLLRNCLSHFPLSIRSHFCPSGTNHSLGSNWTRENQATNKMHWRSIYCFAYIKAKLPYKKIYSPIGWALQCQTLAAPSRFLKSKRAFCFLICSLPGVNFCIFWAYERTIIYLQIIFNVDNGSLQQKARQTSDLSLG